MSQLKIFNRNNNTTNSYQVHNYDRLMELFQQIRKDFIIPTDIPWSKIKFWYNDGKKITFVNDTENPNEVLKTLKEQKIRPQIEIFWPKPKEHGKQVQDLTNYNGQGTVVDGYSRVVSSHKGAGEVIVGDINGAHIIIPEGAMPSTQRVSIQTKMIDSSLLGGHRNITRFVKNDPKKVNDEVNNN